MNGSKNQYEPPRADNFSASKGSIYLVLSERKDTTALKAFDQKHSLSSSVNKNGRFPAINNNKNNVT